MHYNQNDVGHGGFVICSALNEIGHGFYCLLNGCDALPIHGVHGLEDILCMHSSGGGSSDCFAPNTDGNTLAGHTHGSYARVIGGYIYTSL